MNYQLPSPDYGPLYIAILVICALGVWTLIIIMFTLQSILRVLRNKPTDEDKADWWKNN